MIVPRVYISYNKKEKDVNMDVQFTHENNTPPGSREKAVETHQCRVTRLLWKPTVHCSFAAFPLERFPKITTGLNPCHPSGSAAGPGILTA